MPICGQNTLMIGGCNTGSACGSSNGGGGSCGTGGDCNDPKIGPRRNRGRILAEIKEYVLAMLGAPMISLNISDQQLDIAINTTLKIMEYYAPREYFQYYTFRATPGKSVYEMPPDIGYVRQVYYREVPEFAFQASDLDGAIPIEYFYPGGAYASIQGGLIDPIQPIWGRMGDWHLYKMYERMFARESSGLGGWEFVGGYRHIKLYPIPQRAFPVIVHYMQKCKDWDTVTLAMLEGSLCHAKMMVGRVWSKFANLPGPGGGLQLGGQQILQEGLDEYKQWKIDLLEKFGETLSITWG